MLGTPIAILAAVAPTVRDDRGPSRGNGRRGNADRISEEAPAPINLVPLTPGKQPNSLTP